MSDRTVGSIFGVLFFVGAVLVMLWAMPVQPPYSIHRVAQKIHDVNSTATIVADDGYWCRQRGPHDNFANAQPGELFGCYWVAPVKTQP